MWLGYKGGERHDAARRRARRRRRRRSWPVADGRRGGVAACSPRPRPRPRPRRRRRRRPRVAQLLRRRHRSLKRAGVETRMREYGPAAAPRLLVSDSGRVHEMERFSHYVGTQPRSTTT